MNYCSPASGKLCSHCERSSALISIRLVNAQLSMYLTVPVAERSPPTQSTPSNEAFLTAQMADIIATWSPVPVATKSGYLPPSQLLIYVEPTCDRNKIEQIHISLVGAARPHLLITRVLEYMHGLKVFFLKEYVVGGLFLSIDIKKKSVL